VINTGGEALLFYTGKNGDVARILHPELLGERICIAIQNRNKRLIRALGINYIRVHNSKVRAAQE